MKVHNDIVTQQDQQSSAVLILLDLSAAVDVIDHSILFQRLTASCGFRCTAASWIVYCSREGDNVLPLDPSSHTLVSFHMVFLKDLFLDLNCAAFSPNQLGPYVIDME